MGTKKVARTAPAKLAAAGAAAINKADNHINHFVYLIDRSGSMGHLAKDVVDAFEAEIKALASRSKELDQETRISVYLFDDSLECIIYDKDVLRLPSIRDKYFTRGSTSLIDGTLGSIADLKKTAQLYGEHAFVLYALTDGEENTSTKKPADLRDEINDLPDNWTVAVFVPNARGVAEAKTFGFPKDNIAVWSTTAQGVSEVGSTMRKATDNFMTGRKSGVKSTRSLFAFDTAGINKKAVKANLDALATSEYAIFPVRKSHDGMAIKDFVEKATKQGYRSGSAYYQLTKKENVQSRKNICLKEVTTGKVYTGDAVRDMLGLPDYEVKVNPATHPQFIFFVQSTSVNRKLVGDTELIVLN